MEETTPGVVESLIGKAEQYGNTRYELAKLKSVETGTDIASWMVSRWGVMLHIMVSLLFLNIGLAILLGDPLGRMYYGFFIIAAFHLLLGMVFYFFLYRWVKKPVSNFIIKKVLK
jgi:hypothetical protein